LLGAMGHQTNLVSDTLHWLDNILFIL